MTSEMQRKFHIFVQAMQEEAELYEAVQNIFETTEDKEEAANVIHEHYTADIEEAMAKSKEAFLDWQEEIK